MKQPKLKDFNLTKKELRKFRNFDSKDNNKLIESLGVISIGIYIAFYISLIEELPKEITDWIFQIILFLMIGFGIAMFLTFILWISINIIRKIYFSISNPKYKNYKKYISKKEEYESWLLRTKIDFWKSLKGIKLEKEVALLLKSLGQKVELTPGSGDMGIDLIVYKNKRKIVIQCKGHKNPVSPHVIRDLYGAMKHANADSAILISTGGFSRKTKEFSRGKRIELWDISHLISLQEKIKSY